MFKKGFFDFSMEYSFIIPFLYVLNLASMLLVAVPIATSSSSSFFFLLLPPQENNRLKYLKQGL